MIIKIVLVIGIIYAIKLIVKASKIVNNHEVEKKESPKKDNIVDAEYTVIKD